MKDIFTININVLLVISLWILSSFTSSSLSISLVILSFVFAIYKDLKFLIFIFFYFLLVISDSRLDILRFSQTIKPVIALTFFLYSIIFYRKTITNGYSYKPVSFFPFIIFIAISFFIGEFNFIILQKSISFILLFCFTPFLIEFLFFQKNKIYLKSLIYLMVSILILGLVFIFINDDVVKLNLRFRGFFGNPNGLAISALLFLFFFNHIRVVYKSLFSKNEIIIIVIILFFNIFLSESRSCIVALLVYYSFIFLLNYSIIIAVLFSSLIVISYGFISLNPIEFIKTVGLESYIRLETLENASGRYVAWEFLLNKIDYPNIFFGNGIGSTELLFKKNYSFLSRLGHEGNAHNSFLTIWYDTGFLGLLSFFSFIIYSAFSSKNFMNTIPILLGVFISAFYESWLSASLNPFTIILLLIIVIFNVDK